MSIESNSKATLLSIELTNSDTLSKPLLEKEGQEEK